MKIRYSQPAKGRREFLCRGDEARVSRILEPGPYEGMAERIQTARLDPKSEDPLFRSHFWVKQHYWDSSHAANFSPSLPSYHLLKFLTNCLAYSVFPSNFAAQRELRIFRKGELCVYAAYSDFVPDEGQAIQRKTRTRARYYQTMQERGRYAAFPVREQGDEAERKRIPALIPTIERIENSGIILGHPEVNYHLSGDSLVFFDVDGIILDLALDAVKNDVRSAAILGAVYATLMKTWKGTASDMREKFFDADFSHLQCLLTLNILLSMEQPSLMGTDLNEVQARGIEHYESLWKGFEKGKLRCQNALPSSIEAAVQTDPEIEQFFHETRRLAYY